MSTQLYHGQRLDRAHLEAIAAHGFDAIEVVATRTHVDYHDAAALDGLAAWLRETGLRLHSIHAPVTDAVVNGRWSAPFNNASPVEAVRARAVAETVAALDLARRVPVEVLVVHLGLPDVLAAGPGDNDPAAARRSVGE
ncbi:MAG: sugar phosphate isomerase/epimerase, partial [Vicinamibacterales bacterium]|nr:sugar phosphate isomerase/epimerase [Vicinamibacterales bacterium]